MSTIESFDDFYSTEHQANALEMKPFQFRENPNDDKETLKWLSQYFDTIEQTSYSRLNTYRRYQAIFKGIHWRYYDTRDIDRQTNYTQRKPRMVVNFAHDLTEAKVAQMARLGVSVTLMPNNDEQSDINNAKACKKLLDTRKEKIDFEQLQQKSDRIKLIFGHSFRFIEWDKNEGPLSPAYEKMKKKYKGKIPVVKEGKKVKGKYVDSEVRIGDVCIDVLGPDRVFVELGKTKWEDMDFIIRTDWVHIDKLKADYPDKAEDIKQNRREYYNFESTDLTRPADLILVRTLYHRKTKYLPEGAKIIHTDDVILEWDNLPYDHGELPVVPDTDIDVYGEFWGRSFYYLIEQMQRMYNNVQSAIARDYSIGSAPKWMMPKGACDIHDLSNEFTIVEFKGPVAPQLVSSKPTSNQAFEVQDRLQKHMNQLSGVYDISRGEVPQGVTANSALRFLDEQEYQRTIVQERKRKKGILKVYKQMLSLMGQYYEEGDGRTARILGKNNEYLIDSIEDANFAEIYDVQLQNSPALPDTKTGKISAIIDLNTATQTDPIFRKEEIIQLLDLGMEDSFKDEATVAVTAAKTTLQRLLEGKEVEEPKPYDNLLVHYRIFMRAIQEFSFKNKVPKEIQSRMEEHIKQIEFLMFARSKKNMNFAMKLAQLENYPVFFEVPPMPPQLPAMGAQGGGAPQQSGGSPIDLSKAENIVKNNTETK